ncbi:hypothetical protein [Lacipirellula parvula]|uniref:hypothetical protein n=1 Tax=Lacipirellula parvula TaxID=2650471 RepID=UPI0012604D8D|nr:hypothetical protein [Lacipirellula parvula]
MRSLALTDHNYTVDALSEFGRQIKNGQAPQIVAGIESGISSAMDGPMMAEMAMMLDPARIEASQRRERNIIVALMVAIVLGIAWALYRFVVT